jgi:hypothetical protein
MDMAGLRSQCEVYFREIGAWKVAATRWRTLAKRLMNPDRVRFRGLASGKVWERDMIVAPTQKWRRMLLEDEKLSSWSTYQHGPLILALSPPWRAS